MEIVCIAVFRNSEQEIVCPVLHENITCYIQLIYNSIEVDAKETLQWRSFFPIVWLRPMIPIY